MDRESPVTPSHQTPSRQTPSRQSLREELRARRAALTAAQRIAAAGAVAQHLESLPEFLVDRHIAGYWAVRGELPLLAVVGALRRREQRYYLPVLNGDSLCFASWRTDEPLEPNRYGIPEPRVAPVDCTAPADIELVLVPLLGFDRRGNRLGSGAGYYDRSFAFLAEGERPRAPILVGVAYACQEVPSLAAEAWDIPLDFVVTENELIDCNPESTNSRSTHSGSTDSRAIDSGSTPRGPTE
jgi:5-formyltetrahydrofolate cyclo-ligase